MDPEGPGVALAGSSRIGVDRLPEPQVRQADTLHHRLPPCTRQGTGDSALPQVDVAFGLVGDLDLHADVRDLDTTAGT
jgi:hypothetical protein